MSKVKTLEEWIETHMNGDCEVDPPTRDCLISLAQAIQYELSNPTKESESV